MHPASIPRGHIPGAHNLPLFSDDERAVVGTAYKRKGRHAAIRAGLKLVGPKLTAILDSVAHHGVAPGQRVLLYCWRGGMRSGSVAWLLSLCEFEVGSRPARVGAGRRARAGGGAVEEVPCRARDAGGGARRRLP